MKYYEITEMSDAEIADLLGYKKEQTLDEYLEEHEAREEREAYSRQFDGSYEASRGDYEGACLARAEFNAGLIS